jgi:hypothetical protein
MKKAAKRGKRKSSPQRAKTKSRTKITTAGRSKAKRGLANKPGLKLKRVATKAAVAAGVAAINIGPSELNAGEPGANRASKTSESN